MKIPEDLRYTKEHEWLRRDGAKAVLGVTDYAQDKLGGIVYVELPAVGASFAAGAACATVESTKAASDVYLPVAGTISAVNSALEAKPEAINEEPYGAGWLFEFTPADPGALDRLLDPAAYAAYVAGQH